MKAVATVVELPALDTDRYKQTFIIVCGLDEERTEFPEHGMVLGQK
jgi:hypothetical protein